jgi:hypothetical protein
MSHDPYKALPHNDLSEIERAPCYNRMFHRPIGTSIAANRENGGVALTTDPQRPCAAPARTASRAITPISISPNPAAIN